MSLLNDLFAKPLEPEYRDVAERRKKSGQEPSFNVWRLTPALMIGTVAIGLLLAMALLQVQDTQSVVSAERENLIERIREEDANAERLDAQVVALEAEVDELQARRLENSAIGQDLRSTLESQQGVAGTIPVEGPGVRVVVDNADETEGVDPALAKVLDLDLQQVVNGLWAAGAEAVSINGQRLTSLTAIRQADNVIKVNFRPLSPPYTVTAVGDPRTLASRFSEGPGGQWMRAASTSPGLKYSVTSEDSVTIPGRSAPLLYAHPQEVP
jgi:uncharacterized protein YlxW (UPF0749 family)